MKSLLEGICDVLRRTYALEAPLDPIESYVIGDAGLRQLYSRSHGEIRSEAGEGGRLLVRETARGVRACIYFPDAMIRHLEAKPPQRGLHDGNVDAFAVLVEDVRRGGTGGSRRPLRDACDGANRASARCRGTGSTTDRHSTPCGVAPVRRRCTAARTRPGRALTSPVSCGT